MTIRNDVGCRYKEMAGGTDMHQVDFCARSTKWCQPRLRDEAEKERASEKKKKNGRVRSLTSNEGMTTVITRELDESRGSSSSQETIAQTDNEQARSLMGNKMTIEVIIQSFKKWRRTTQNVVQMRDEDTGSSNKTRKDCARTARDTAC